MPNMKNAKSWLCKKAPLSVKGAKHLDWVNLDQFYNVVLEEFSSMRHDIVLVGDILCERGDFIKGGLGFCKLSTYKRKGKAA